MKREVEKKYVLRTIICKRKPCKYYDQIGRRGNVGYKVKGDLFLLSETFWEITKSRNYLLLVRGSRLSPR